MTWKAYLGIFLSTTIVILISIKILPHYRPIEVPHLKAPSYLPSGSCDNRRYNLYDKINKACADYHYEYRDDRRYHLAPYRSAKYYRIGNDLVALSCGFWKTCSVVNVYRDVYYQ